MVVLSYGLIWLILVPGLEACESSDWLATSNLILLLTYNWFIFIAAYGSFSLVEVFSDKLISWYDSEL